MPPSHVYVLIFLLFTPLFIVFPPKQAFSDDEEEEVDGGEEEYEEWEEERVGRSSRENFNSFQFGSAWLVSVRVGPDQPDSDWLG